MSSASAPAIPAEAGASVASRLRAVPALLVGTATALVLIAVAVLLMVQPAYVHLALDQAGSATILGIDGGQAHELSDRTINELLAGPGTYAFAGPDGSRFFDEAESSHLRDAGTVLWLLLRLAALGAVVIAFAIARPRPAWAWRAVGRSAAVLALGVTVVGVFFLVAFDLAFELFHRLFFPGGNWAFDPGTQRLVQLYPIAFWQLTSAVFAVLVIGLSALTWWLASRRASAAARAEAAG